MCPKALSGLDQAPDEYQCSSRPEGATSTRLCHSAVAETVSGSSLSSFARKEEKSPDSETSGSWLANALPFQEIPEDSLAWAISKDFLHARKWLSSMKTGLVSASE